MVGNRQPRGARSGADRRVIITADDFGLHPAVNKAVVQAYRHGVLTTTSLMVAAPAAAEAVAQAQALPGLGVGLHLVLADGQAKLAPRCIPSLVDRDGRFDDNMVASGLRFFFTRSARRQLAAEIEAQFAAFAETGLPLDHVNAHKHFHLHPTVLALILGIGRKYGLQAVRLPREPLRADLTASTRHRRAPQTLAVGLLTPWLGLMQYRLDQAGVARNDRVFGVAETGRMHEATLLKAVGALPRGVTEIYLHPATENGLTPSMADYDHVGELNALLSPRVAAALNHAGIARIRYTDLGRH